MKKVITTISYAIISILSVFGISIKTSNANIPSSDLMNIKESTPLYLEVSSDMLQHNEQDNNNLLAWHYSHYSHASHYSHDSHSSHYSHYSGR